MFSTDLAMNLGGGKARHAAAGILPAAVTILAKVKQQPPNIEECYNVAYANASTRGNLPEAATSASCVFSIRRYRQVS